MADIAELGLVVDTRQVAAATKALSDFVRASEQVDKKVTAGQIALEKLAAAQARTAKAATDAEAAIKRKERAASDAAAADTRAELAALRLAQAQERAARAAANGQTAYGGMLQQLRQMQGAFGSAGAALGQFSGLLGPLGGLVAGGFGVAAILGFVKAVADAGSQVQLMQARIGLLTGPGGAVPTFNALFEASQRTGTALQSTVDTFARIGFAARDLGASNADVARLTETVQKLGRIGGATGVELSAGMMQLGQALAAGRLNGDELRSILENLPLVARAIAENLGVSVGQLRAMGAAGQLTSEKVFGALLSASQKADEQFAKLPVTMEQASQKAANAWAYFAAELNKATGFSNALAKALDVVADSAVRAAKRMAGDMGQALQDNIALLRELQAEAAAMRQGDQLVSPPGGGPPLRLSGASMASGELKALEERIAKVKELAQAQALQMQEDALLAAHWAGVEKAMGPVIAANKAMAAGLDLMLDKLDLVKAGIDPVTGAVRLLTKEQVALETITTAVTAAIEQGGDALAIFGGDAAAALKLLAEARKKLDPEAKKQADTDKRLADQLNDSLIPATEQYAKDVAALSRVQKDLAPDVYAKALENLNNWLWENADAYKVLRAQVDELAKAGRGYEEVLEDVAKAQAKDRTDSLKKLYEDAQKVIEHLKSATEVYADRVKTLAEMHRRGMLSAEQYGREIENLNQWVQEQDPAFQRAKQAAEDYAKELERVVGRTADRLVDFGADTLFDAMTGKSQNFWEEFEKLGKRAIAQIAAEALIRPIVVPIIQSVVAAAPGLFGIQQQGAGAGLLGGFAQGAAQGAGSSLFGGSNPISSLLQGVQNMFSPNNFIANMFPSLFGTGPALVSGMTSSAAAEGMIAGAGAAGPLAGLAPFLPMLAIALPLLLSFFGGKKSVGPNSNAIINFERDAAGVLTNPGGLAIGGLGADNGGDREYAKKMAEAATKTFNTIVDRVGGRVTSVPGAGQSGQLELGVFQEGNRNFSIVGGVKAEFGSAEEAVADFARRTLQAATIEGLSPDVRLALSKSVAASVEDLGKDVDFAFGFRRSVEMAAAGPGTRQAQALGFRYAGQDFGLQQRLANRDYIANARRLFGEDSTQLGEAQATARQQLLNLMTPGPAEGAANAPLEGMAAEIARITAQFNGLKEALVDTGLSAAEAQAEIDGGLLKTFGRMADEAAKGIADSLLAVDSPAAAQAKALLDAQEKRRKDLVDLQTAAGRTVDTSTLDQLSTSELGKLLDGLDLKGFADIIRNIAEITADPAKQAALRGDIRGRADTQLSDAVLAAQNPAAAQAKALAEAQGKRRADATAVGANLANLDKLDRLEAGAALIGLTATQLDEAAKAMAEIGELTGPMREALNQAYAFAEFVAGAGKLQVDIARWTYESSQLQQTAADAKRDYIDALQAEIQVQQQAADGYSRLAESMKSTRLGLLIDSNLSPLSPGARLTEARSQFQEIAAKAQAGDLKAGEQLPEIARAFLEASKAYNAGTVDYYNDFQTVQGVLQNTETVAEQNAKTATATLATLRQQLAEVQGQSGDIKTIAEAAAAWQAAQNAVGRTNFGAQQKAAFDQLATDFQNLYAGAASEGERTQIYQAAAQQRDALLGSITDIATLQAIGKQYYQGDTRDSGAIYLRSRLYSLGAVPAFEAGGMHAGGMRLVGERGPEIEATGAARYWSAEQTADMLARSAGAAANDNAQLLVGVTGLSLWMQQNVAVSREGFRLVVDRLDRILSTLEGMESNDRQLIEALAAA